MQKLTATEEEIMTLIWATAPCTVRDLLDAMPEPRSPHSTVSSVVRILEKKQFVGYKAYGKTYEYYPLIAKEAYANRSLLAIVGDYFNGSAANLVSFLVEKEQIDVDELRKLLDNMKE
jgi:BlaI family transcriptional regulator, penicillinase repressor